jgi:hypothetical protein
MKHGDTAVLKIRGELYKGTIEERMLGQWPEKRSGLFFTRPLYFPYLISNIHGNIGETDLGEIEVLL